MYRHVDILNARGFEAYILHCHTGHRCTWFENQTRIVYLKKIKFQKEDLIVFPEVVALYFNKEVNPSGLRMWFKRLFSATVHKYYTFELSQLPLRKVIFNQGTYLTFFKYPIAKNNFITPYQRNDVVATLSVSNDNSNYLEYIFTKHPVYRVFLSANTDLFKPAPVKEKWIAFYSRKSVQDIRQVMNILRIKSLINDFEVKIIQNNSEKEVAEILSKSVFYLSFGAAESFPLLPLEAMQSGCVVIGYHGRGGKEFFQQNFCYPVESGDIIGFVKAIEIALKKYRDQPQMILEMGQKAAEFIQQNYSSAIEENSLAEAWQKILATTSA